MSDKEKGNKWVGYLFFGVLPAVATIIGAIITAKPDLIGKQSPAQDTTRVAQTQKSPDTRTGGDRQPVSDRKNSTGKINSDTKITDNIRSNGKNDRQQPASANGNKEPSHTLRSHQPDNSIVPAAQHKVDISGIWKFDAAIEKGKDTSGTLFDFHSNYKPIVELTQLGTQLKGTYSGPPAIMCGSGTISGSLQQEAKTTRVQWVLNCDSECKGEQRTFSGIYDKEHKSITGSYRPANTPRKKGCWLAYEKLSGKAGF